MINYHCRRHRRTGWQPCEGCMDEHIRRVAVLAIAGAAHCPIPIVDQDSYGVACDWLKERGLISDEAPTRLVGEVDE